MNCSQDRSIRQAIEEYAAGMDLPLLFVDGHDNAIMGICRTFNTIAVLYDRNKVIENLEADMSYEEAVEYFDFNIAGAYVGEHTPAFFELPD